MGEIIVSATITTEATIVVTKEERVVSNRALDTEFVSPCNHEETDTRMFLHAKHAALGGSRSINIVSSDTDVFVIGVAVLEDLNVDALWVTFEKAKICDGYQSMILLDHWVQDQKHYLSFMHLRVVIQCQRLLGKVKRQHGRPGMCLRTSHKYFDSEVLLVTV